MLLQCLMLKRLFDHQTTIFLLHLKMSSKLIYCGSSDSNNPCFSLTDALYSRKGNVHAYPCNLKSRFIFSVRFCIYARRVSVLVAVVAQLFKLSFCIFCAQNIISERKKSYYLLKIFFYSFFRQKLDCLSSLNETRRVCKIKRVRVKLVDVAATNSEQSRCRRLFCVRFLSNPFLPSKYYFLCITKESESGKFGFNF